MAKARYQAMMSTDISGTSRNRIREEQRKNQQMEVAKEIVPDERPVNELQAFEGIQASTQNLERKVLELTSQVHSMLLQMPTQQDLNKLKDSTFNYILFFSFFIIAALGYLMIPAQ